MSLQTFLSGRQCHPRSAAAYRFYRDDCKWMGFTGADGKKCHTPLPFKRWLKELAPSWKSLEGTPFARKEAQ
jgi:hypothetical protein